MKRYIRSTTDTSTIKNMISMGRSRKSIANQLYQDYLSDKIDFDKFIECVRFMNETDIPTTAKTYVVDIYDGDGDWERSKTFDDYKTATKWVDQYNYDNLNRASSAILSAKLDYALAADLVAEYYDTDPEEAYKLVYEEYGDSRLAKLVKDSIIDEHREKPELQSYDIDEEPYTPSATRGDYSPSSPWNAPGMSVSDFI